VFLMSEVHLQRLAGKVKASYLWAFPPTVADFNGKGPVVPSVRALLERLKFTIRRHKFNKDSLLLAGKVKVSCVWFPPTVADFNGTS